MRKLNQSDGFTLVELMLATAFFSFVMLFAVLGFMQINRTYHRGLAQKNLQNAARVVVDDIADQVRSAAAGSVTVLRPPGNNFRLCIGSVRYGFNQHIGALPTDNSFTSEVFDDDLSRIVLARDPDPTKSCDGPGGTFTRHGAGNISLLDRGLLVQYLNLEQIGTTNTYRLTVVVSTGELDDFETFGLDAKCKVQTGDEFCHVTKLETAVTTRN